MRKALYWVHETLDGFIEGPNGEFDWPAMGPELSVYSRALNDRTNLQLVESRTLDSRAVLLRYQHAGQGQ